MIEIIEKKELIYQDRKLKIDNKHFTCVRAEKKKHGFTVTLLLPNCETLDYWEKYFEAHLNFIKEIKKNEKP